jgi:predicted outer membrane repeat protein
MKKKKLLLVALTLSTLAFTANNVQAEIITTHTDNNSSKTIEGDTYQGINYSGAGGAILNKSSLTISSSTFGGSSEGEGNSASQGGAIQNNSSLILNATNDFISNTATWGGAILNFASLEVTENNFTSNTATSSGGAIYNQATEKTNKISNSTFTNNSAKFGGAIYNVAGTLTLATSEFTKNTATSSGGAIYNADTTTIRDSKFTSNSATNYYGGAIYNEGTLSASSVTFSNSDDFTGDNAKFGGAIYNATNGTIAISDSKFIGNKATTSGGAIYNKGTIGTSDAPTTGLTFTNNQAAYGGAIYNNGTIGTSDAPATGLTFQNNTATENGGAVYNNGTLSASGMTFSNSDDFTGDNAKFGGAIYNATNGTITLSNSQFTGNKATTSGGAIYNAGTIGTSDTPASNLTFTNNQAQWGGAIYNTGTLNLTISEFTDNQATVWGGAIYNKNILNIDNSTFTNNGKDNIGETYGGAICIVGGNATITDTIFTQNHNTSYVDSTANELNKWAMGGAIHVGGELSVSGTITKNEDGTSTYTTQFNGNKSDQGGAIAIETNSKASAIVTNVLFNGNEATINGGAIVNYNKATIENSEFVNNKATTVSQSDKFGGGAIFVGSLSDTTITGSKFSNNSAITGGAIAGRDVAQNNTAAKLSIKDSVFDSNTATGNGGAIANTFSNTTVTDTTFTGNKADGLGGAIYNDGADNQGVLSNIKLATSTFTGNSATSGGAIYNNGDVTITDTSFTNNTATENGGAIFSNTDLTIAAANENVVFSGNKAADGADIYMNTTINEDGSKNTPNLALNASNEKSISLDGGISGNEKYNLNINTTLTNEDGSVADKQNTGTVILSGAIKNATTTVDNGALQLDEGVSLNNTSIAMQSDSKLNVNTNVTIGDKNNTFVSDGATLNLAANTTVNNATLTDTVINATKGNSEFNLANTSSVTSATLAENTSLTLNTVNSLTLSSVTGDSSDTSSLKLNRKEGSTGSVVFDGSVEKVNIDVANGTLQLDEGAKLTATSLTMQSGSKLQVNTDIDLGELFVSNGATLNFDGSVTATEADIRNSKINVASGTSKLSSVLKDATINVNGGSLAIDTIGDANVTSATLAENTSLTLNSANDLTIGSVTGEDKTSSKLNLNQNEENTGKVSVTSAINNTAIDMQYGELVLADKALIDNSTLNVGNATLHAINNAVETYGNNITLNNSILTADIDLSKKTADNFANATQNGKMTISNVNFMNGVKTTSHSVNFDLAKAMGLQGGVNITDELANQTTTFLNPIRYLTGGVTKDGMVSFAPTGNSYKDFNPAILASPIATQLGGYLTQLNSYDEAFRNMDMYMLMTQKQRQALKLKNRYAVADSNLIFDPTMSIHENKAGWFRPYATFENVPLRRGPRVSNVAYGSFFGAESELYDLGHGWDGMWGLYAGYNGSHQAYSGIGIYQNGGTLGAVGMAYKGNFFTGLTINAGANAGEASTMYGTDNFSMLMAGIASKSGYNFEMADGKFIIQPSLQLSYSFVNTFDYTNAAGIKLDSDPLHAIQIEPGVKFIGNLKHGWQPYLGVSMVWNIMDRTHFLANEASIPSMSVKPYVRYGIGVRKTWGERFTGFFQCYFTSGGRNGVGLQTGLRWAIGKAPSSQKKTGSVPTPKKTEIKLGNRA